MNRIMNLLVVALLLACSRGSGGMGPDDQRFIETMVELRRAAQTSQGDVAAYEAAKVAILSQRRVTEDDLRAYIQTHTRDLQHLAAVWESINVRLSQPVLEQH